MGFKEPPERETRECRETGKGKGKGKGKKMRCVEDRRVEEGSGSDGPMPQVACAQVALLAQAHTLETDHAALQVKMRRGWHALRGLQREMRGENRGSRDR